MNRELATCLLHHMLGEVEAQAHATGTRCVEGFNGSLGGHAETRTIVDDRDEAGIRLLVPVSRNEYGAW